MEGGPCQTAKGANARGVFEGEYILNWIQVRKEFPASWRWTMCSCASVPAASTR